ncbi:MAG: pantoate--beta-alanine ligase [Legionella sp.]|nr:pantoate--beta-alanine ligase [Legionella sp.]
MKIFHHLEEWLIFRQNLAPAISIGFVPTMGNLHAGHASLFARSKEENDVTVATVFVNPAQFNQVDDYTNYPRTLDADLELLQNAGVDCCILPTEEAMYGDGYRYAIMENKLCEIMEGKQRPGHFNGVLTIVMKLLNLVKPTAAYFGEKDYQQYLLIRGMAEAFFMGVEIKPCPTIREASGLAYSSRNNRLSPEARVIAEKFATIFHQDKSCAEIVGELQREGITVEYVLDYEKRRFAAVVIGDVRLIDNYERG